MHLGLVRTFWTGVKVLGETELGPVGCRSSSVMDFAHLGSTLSLRSSARLGSTFSVFGISRLGASLSVLGMVHLGSALAQRSFARMGSSVSVLDYLHLGASLSFRSFARLSSSVSLVGMSRLGSALQVSLKPKSCMPVDGAYGHGGHGCDGFGRVLPRSAHPFCLIRGGLQPLPSQRPIQV